MRKKLGKLKGQRFTFTAIFERFGKKRGYKGFPEDTILLKDIRDLEGNHIVDRLWFNLTKQFQAADLNQGDRIKFDARCRKYKKGYRGWRFEVQIECPPEIDYKLSYPTKIKIISRAKC